MSELRISPSKRKFSGTPMKTLLAQEMSKEVDSKQSPPNLVAKLMGLDSLPMQLPPSISPGSRSNGYIQHNRSRSLTGTKKIQHFNHGRSYSEMQMLHGFTEYGDYSDMYDIWQQSQSQNESSIGENSPKKGKSVNEKKMALIRQKFTEAKLLASDEKLRQSKQFQDAVEVLSSNRDLFLKFLQEPNSLISRHLHDLQTFPPPPETKRITVLKPSKVIDVEQRSKKSSPVSGFSPPCEDVDGFAAQPTRIVLLKPGNVQGPGILHEDNLFHNVENEEIQESQELTNEISENVTANCRDAFVFSNDDDSSFKKSVTEYVDGNCSDFEATSPILRHSWEFINRFESPCSSSSFSHASYSPESSVFREAKKRLSQRWALMASRQASLEQQTHHRSSSTLGEMLSLTVGKKPVTREDQESPRPVPLNEIAEVHADSPSNLSRSKSASSSTFNDGSDNIEVPKEPTKKTNGLKWRLSSLFFSKSRKSKKENRDESQICAGAPDFAENIYAKVGSSITNHLVDRRLRENHDQPSLITVLDHTFEEDVRESFGKNMCCQSLRSNLIDKSPPIGSMPRSLSWNESFLGSTSPRPTKPPSGPSFTEEERQDLLDFIETLLSESGRSWHSPETPLDPSLRHKLSTQFDREPPNESKGRKWRSNRKLVFDFVNAFIIEISRDRTISVSRDDVWARMKGWLSDDDVYGEDEDDRTSMVVEREVKNAVVGGAWKENLSLEIDNLGMEIEKKLVEEFLDDAVVDFVRLGLIKSIQ